MRVPTTRILLLHIVLFAYVATAAPRTKDHEWMSAEARSVRSETLEEEIRTALEAALEGQQEDQVVLVTEKPVFVKDDDDDLVQPEVKPQDDNYVVPSYSPVGSENEFGSEDTNKLTPSLILGIEKQLQGEMGQMEGQISLLHTLVSSIFGQQVTLNHKDDFDPNVVVVNVPQQLGSAGIGDHNPFNLGFDPFLNDNKDDDNDDAWSSWFQDRPKFPSLSDVFGFPDSKVNNTFEFPGFGGIGLSKNDTEFGLPNFFGELPNDWSNLPSNYSNSTHEIQHVNGSIIDVNEAINKKSGEGYNFFSHKQVINVRPEDMEILKDSNQENGKEIVADTEEQTEEAEEETDKAEKETEEAEETEEETEEAEEQTEEAEEQIEEIANEGKEFENNEIITRNENEIEGVEEEVPFVEKHIGNELSEFSEFQMEAENSIEAEEVLIPNRRLQGPEEFSLGETLDEGEFSLGETLDKGEFSLDETLDEGEFSLDETLDEGEFSLGETLDGGELLDEILDEGEFSLGETLDEGEFSMGKTLEEGEFSLGKTQDEGEFSLGKTLNEGEFSLGETLDEGEFSLGKTLNEGEFSLGETLDEGLSMNHEPLLLPRDQLVLPEASVFGSQYENNVHDHELVDFISDQLSMPDKSAYYDIRSLEAGTKNSVHNYESTYRDLSDDTRVNRISANMSGMRMIDPNAEIFDYKRVLEESKPIQ